MEIDGKEYSEKQIKNIVRQYERRRKFIEMWKEKNKYRIAVKKKLQNEEQAKKELNLIYKDVEWEE